VSIYEGTQTERDYRAGVDDGRAWASADLQAREPVTFWLETFRDEVRAARINGTRGTWAYYLGVLRGYREETRNA
jgi:hypothetical protein